MSSQSQATSETAPLLGNSSQAGQSSGSPVRGRLTFSPEILLIPVAFATKLAASIPATTIVDFVRRVVCRRWNISHGDPATFPADGPIPPQLCNAPEIQRYFATAIAAFSTTEGILAVVGCGILSRISSRYGRKPALLLVLIAGIMGNCLIPGSQYTPDWVTDWVFLLGMLLQMSSGPPLFSYLVNMYIVDVCIPEDRTTALSKIGGWAALGTCISFALGGSITTKTGNPLIVFYMAAAIFLVVFIYITSILPESFGHEQREALSRMRQERPTNGFLARSLFIFEPLRMLVPGRKSDGTRNWRLTWCGAHMFIFMLANGYISDAWLVLVTSKYGLTPADTGLFLTTVNISNMAVLVLIVPPLVYFLRPLYNRKTIRSLPVEEASSRGGGLETSDHIDVHLGFVSCVVAAVFYLGAAESTTNQALILSGVCIGFASLHGPTIRSLTAGSVDPLKQGEALAAIDISCHTACVLSPIIMGAILTTTINTTPLLVFYIHLVVVLISGVLLFLIRDADGYRKPHEA